MKRQAFLLGSTRGKEALPEVGMDLDAIETHLLSIKGGAWNGSEITNCLDISLSMAREILESIHSDNPDFFFFYWSGHGGFSRIHNQLVMDVAPKEDMFEEEVYKIGQKNLLVFDSCRSYFPEKTPLLEGMQVTAGLEELESEREVARGLYENAIQFAHPGYEAYYSSRKGQYSHSEDFLGSKFTICLLEAAEACYYSMESMTDISMHTVVLKAAPCCKRDDRGGSQTPGYAIPKSNWLYPFVVKP